MSTNQMNTCQDVGGSSLKILGPVTKQHLALRLDSHKVLLSESRFHRDWRGIAQFAELDVAAIRGSKNSSPTEECLRLWIAKGGTIQDLWNALESMDRFDLKEDSNQSIYDNYEKFLQIVPIPFHFDEYGILTIEDADNIKNGGQFESYAALVLYADEDIEFVKIMVEKLEGDYDLKLCLIDRQLLGGVLFGIEAVVHIIQHRVSRVIVVLSQSFLKSSTNHFFSVFAQSLGITQRKRIVIPCMIEVCEKPPTLAFVHSLDYFRTGGYWDYWGRLASAVGNVDLNRNNLAVSNTPQKAPRLRKKSESSSFLPMLKNSTGDQKKSAEQIKPVLEDSKTVNELLPDLPDVPSTSLGDSCDISPMSTTSSLVHQYASTSYQTVPSRSTMKSKFIKLIKKKKKKQCLSV